MENFVTIDRDVYEGLLRSEHELRLLEGAGVDNWDGCDYAFEDYDGTITYNDPQTGSEVTVQE